MLWKPKKPFIPAEGEKLPDISEGKEGLNFSWADLELFRLSGIDEEVRKSCQRKARAG